MNEEEGEIKKTKQETRVVSIREWACKPLQEKYKLSKEIGQGSYGSVFEAYRLDNHKKIAIKKMQNFQEKEEKEGKSFGFPITTLRQIKLLQHLQHPNILKINEVVFQKQSRHHVICLCLDLMDTDLRQLTREKDYKFTPYRIQQICKQLLEGLAYLHSKSVAHRDLKPANILINSEGIVKIADFGLAKKLGKFSTTLVVTLWYRAPELFFGLKNYTTNIDIWSLGCVLVEFMIGKPLFGKCTTEKSMLEKIFELVGTPDACEWQEAQNLQNYEMYRPPFSKQTEIILHLKKIAPNFQEENLLLDLIEKMLRLNPYSRYSAAQCLAHDFFNNKYEEEALLPESIVEKKLKTDRGQDHVVKKPKYN